MPDRDLSLDEPDFGARGEELERLDAGLPSWSQFQMASDPLVVEPVVVDEEDEVVQGRVGRSRRRVILDDDEITVPVAAPTPRRQRRQHVQRGQNSPIKFDGGGMSYR